MIPPDVARVIESAGPERVERISRPDLGLTAYIVIDSTVLGPAAGGVRTAPYATEAEAVADACRLARSMTYKCALGGVDAGGGKAVVLANEGLKRAEAFEALGRAVDALEGDFRTAGDLGTTEEDLRRMKQVTRYVHSDVSNLAGAVGRGVMRCAEACANVRGRPGIHGLRVAVQGCGSIGAAVAEAMHGAGASVVVADVDPARARAVAERLGGRAVAPEEILYEPVDILAPCAVGDVITTDNVGHLRAWAVCGGANHIAADDATHRALVDRNIAFVPDLVSSAGAVIEGIGRTVMGLDDRSSLIDALRHTATLVLEDAAKDGNTPMAHAIRRARKRLANAA